MEPDHTEACYLFGDIVESLFTPLIDVTNTYQYVSRCVDFAAPQIIAEDADQFGAVALDPDLQAYFPNRGEILDGTYRDRVGIVVQTQLESAKRRVASASLVFAHAIFEGSVSDCMKVAFLARPSDWLSVVETKKFSLVEFAEKGLAPIQKESIETHIAGLEKQSLIKKLDVFFQVARPPQGFVRIKDYQYDRERIERLDRARHKAAHDDPIAYEPGNLKDDVDYLRMTLMHLLSVLINRYDVRTLARPAP
jgi:hypothetical protein